MVILKFVALQVNEDNEEDLRRVSVSCIFRSLSRWVKESIVIRLYRTGFSAGEFFDLMQCRFRSCNERFPTTMQLRVWLNLWTEILYMNKRRSNLSDHMCINHLFHSSKLKLSLRKSAPQHRWQIYIDFELMMIMKIELETNFNSSVEPCAHCWEVDVHQSWRSHIIDVYQ